MSSSSCKNATVLQGCKNAKCAPALMRPLPYRCVTQSPNVHYGMNTMQLHQFVNVNSYQKLLFKFRVLKTTCFY